MMMAKLCTNIRELNELFQVEVLLNRVSKKEIHKEHYLTGLFSGYLLAVLVVDKRVSKYME